jgi:uncharacterized protein YchJ
MEFRMTKDQSNLDKNNHPHENSNESEAVHVHGPNCNHGHNHGHQHALKPIMREMPKIGRNDPCSCGSQKKFKKCCGI